jgi:hypothetical protein
MEDNWHYAIAGEDARGPISTYELGHILAGTDASRLLVWRPGMPDWAAPGDVPALKGFLHPSAGDSRPGLSGPGTTAEGATEAPWPSAVTHPWRRYFARILDTTCFVVVFFLFIGILFPSLFAPPAKGTERLMDLFFQVIGFIAYAPFEAFCMHIFGNTMGKALYGIRVTTRTDDDMSLPAALNRSFRVLVQGIGLGIPIISLVTLLTSYNTLRQEGVTSWDRRLDCIITHRPFSYLRIVMLTVTWIVLILIVVALRSIT